MDAVRISSGCSVPVSELTFRFSRSSGSGGQNVNTRDTRVELVFDVASSPSLGPRQRARAMRALASKLDSSGRLRVVVSEERSQAQNRERAIERFAELMAEALRPPPAPRRATKPSRAARERRLKEKQARSRVKRDRAWKPDD